MIDATELAGATHRPDIHSCPDANKPVPLVERAYQLASAGKTRVEIRAILQMESYDTASIIGHLGSRTLLMELKRLAAQP